MQYYRIESMSCQHCVSTIEKTLKEQDPHASVSVDLNNKTVALESTLDQATVLNALDDAGYEDAVVLNH